MINLRIWNKCIQIIDFDSDGDDVIIHLTPEEAQKLNDELPKLIKELQNSMLNL